MNANVNTDTLTQLLTVVAAKNAAIAEEKLLKVRLIEEFGDHKQSHKVEGHGSVSILEGTIRGEVDVERSLMGILDVVWDKDLDRKGRLALIEAALKREGLPTPQKVTITAGSVRVKPNV